MTLHSVFLTGNREFYRAICMISPNRPFLFAAITTSSTLSDSFPIELAWTTERGRTDGYFIRPEPEWTKWSTEGEALHGISREKLDAAGVFSSRAIAHFLEAAHNTTVVVSLPLAFSEMLDMLFNTAKRKLQEVGPVQIAYEKAVAPLTSMISNHPDSTSTLHPEDVAARVIAKYEDLEAKRDRLRHRASEDARALWWTWNEVKGCSLRIVGSLTKPPRR